MSRIRIVGIGNALAGDDAVGIRAVEMIRQDGWPGVESMALAQPGPELFDDMDGDDLLILIDACQSTAAAGSVYCFDRKGIVNAGLRHGSTHAIGLADWIELTAAAGASMPTVRVFAVELQQCDMGEALSEAVATAMPELLQQIQACIDEIFHSTEACHA